MPDKRLLSAAEAAQMMGIGQKKFRSLVHNGRFPLPVEVDDDEPDRRRRMRRWPLEDVTSWLHLKGRRYKKRKNVAEKSTRQSGVK